MEPGPERNELAFSPAAILQIFNNALTPGPTKKMVQVRGVYQPRSNQNYGGFYYGVIKDEASEALLTVVTPALIHPKLSSGKLITVNGFIIKKVVPNGSRIDVQLQITELIGQDQTTFSEEDIKVVELLQAKAAKGYRDVQSFIKEQIINDTDFKIAIVIGKTGIIDNDIKHQLRESIGYYKLSFVRASLGSETEIIMTVADLDAKGYDIIAISRGGGENLDIFNRHSLASKLIDMKALFVTAIGHRDDVTLVQRIADKAFITPSELGQFLNDTYNSTKEELEHSRAKLVKSITEQLRTQYQQQINALTQVNAKEVASLKQLNEETKAAMKKQMAEENSGLIRVQEQRSAMLAQQIAALEKDTRSKDGLISSYKSQLSDAQSKTGFSWGALIVAIIIGVIIGVFLAKK